MEKIESGLKFTLQWDHESFRFPGTRVGVEKSVPEPGGDFGPLLGVLEITDALGDEEMFVIKRGAIL